eukprot:2001013-Amphidinium_carterae.1
MEADLWNLQRGSRFEHKTSTLFVFTTLRRHDRDSSRRGVRLEVSVRPVEAPNEQGLKDVSQALHLRCAATQRSLKFGEMH